jgi:hypothetical protein
MVDSLAHAMVKEVTKRVVDLSLDQTQVFADFLNRFTALMERGDLPNRHAQAVHDWLPATNAWQPNDVRMICLYRVWHGCFSLNGRIPMTVVYHRTGEHGTESRPGD